jgi:hypothetical protein
MSLAATVQPKASETLPVEVSATERAIHVAVRDGHWIEWATAVPLPDHGQRRYTIEVEFELPPEVRPWESPWPPLQTFTRLDGASGVLPSGDPATDTLRRAALSLAQLLDQSRRGFERHCRLAAARADDIEGGHSAASPTTWLDLALRLAREARTKLTHPTTLDSAQCRRERELVDEFVSVCLFDLLADADHAVREVTTNSHELARTSAIVGAHHSIDAAVRDERAYRTSRRFSIPDACSATSMQRYVIRAAQLERHFTELLRLDRETHLIDESVAKESAVVVALLAGAGALAFQLVFGKRLSSASQVACGLLVLATLAWVARAVHDGICAVAGAWFTGKPYRYHARCTTFCPVPGRRGTSRAVVARAREWHHQTIHALPDARTSESMVSLRASVVGYMQKGLVTRPPSLVASGATRIWHVFRCDLSPLLTRVHRGDRRVPATEAGQLVNFHEAPGRYRIPLLVRVSYDDQNHEERVTLVVDRRGLRIVAHAPPPARDDEPHSSFSR